MKQSFMDVQYFWNKLLKKIRGKAIKNSCIGKGVQIGAGSHILNCTIGRYSYLGYDCSIFNCDIGAFCSIGQNVTIGGIEHPVNWVSTSSVFYDVKSLNIKNAGTRKKFAGYNLPMVKKTEIGNDVWIGDSVLIKQGIKIGDGAVIGMGSVVTKDVESYSIVAGVPARTIRKRFSEEIIQKLRESGWWNFSDDKLEKFAKYIKEPAEFLLQLEKADT